MEVIILAGGLGTRLRSVVNDIPKCMAPVCERPFLHYLLVYLQKFSIDRVVLSLGYKHEVVTNWIEKNHFPFKISYSIEDEPLGTGGAIKKAMKEIIGDKVFIINGDTFFNVDLNIFYKEHIDSSSLLSIALKPMNNFNRYGIVRTDSENRISDFKEKDNYEAGQINGGVYLINVDSDSFENLPDKFSFETEVLMPEVKNGQSFGFIHDDYFIDIGIPEDYAKANIDFKMLLK